MQLVRTAYIRGNPGEDQLYRWAAAMVNSRVDEYGASAGTPRFFDTSSNPYYRIGKSFQFARAHNFLSKQSCLISAQAEIVYAENVAEDYKNAQNCDEKIKTSAIAKDERGKRSEGRKSEKVSKHRLA